MCLACFVESLSGNILKVRITNNEVGDSTRRRDVDLELRGYLVFIVVIVGVGKAVSRAAVIVIVWPVVIVR